MPGGRQAQPDLRRRSRRKLLRRVQRIWLIEVPKGVLEPKKGARINRFWQLIARPSRVHPLNLLVARFHWKDCECPGPRCLGVRYLGIRSLGIRSLGIRSLGIRYLGKRWSEIQCRRPKLFARTIFQGTSTKSSCLSFLRLLEGPWLHPTSVRQVR